MKKWNAPEIASLEINQTMSGGCKYIPELFIPTGVDWCKGEVYGYLTPTGPVQEQSGEPDRGKPETSDSGDTNQFS